MKKCPSCGKEALEFVNHHFPGIRMLEELKCNSCNKELFADLPIAHANSYPVAVSKDGSEVYDPYNNRWFAEMLVYGIKNRSQDDLLIEKKVFTARSKEAILLNCVDYLYGHALLKLFNASFYIQNHKDKSLILILPQYLEWLIPDGLCEVWLVDIKLGDSKRWFSALDAFVKDELSNFEKCFLSLAFPHPKPEDYNLSEFCKVNAFELGAFTLNKPIISIILRENRFWLRKKWSNRLFELGSVKYKKLVFSMLHRFQLRNYKKLIRKIKGKLPESTINIIGLGGKGQFTSGVKDLRVDRPGVDIEAIWAEAYAKSHLVIGIHGSNMIIPTALSAGFIEIMPRERLGNMTQDISINPKLTKKEQLYLQRHVDHGISPNRLAEVAVSLIKFFPNFYVHNGKDFNSHRLVEDTQLWSNYRLKNIV